MKTINKIAFVLSTLLLCTACDSFLNHDVPQATLSEEQVNDPLYIDNICISAYAIFISAEDINSSFSMWNFDVRSDDAYKGDVEPAVKARLKSFTPHNYIGYSL